MDHADETRERLMAENAALRQYVAILEAAQTAHVQTEQALRSAQKALEQRVRTRTAALHEREAHYRQLIEESLQGILIHRDDRVLCVNQAYADIFGYATADEISRLDTLNDLIAPHERERLTRYRDARLAGESVPAFYEYQGVGKDGSLLWLDMTVRIIAWEGRPATQSIITDITERKQVEEALRQSEARYRTLVDTIPHGIQENDVSGTITFSNRAHARLLGYADGELLGKAIWDVLASELERDDLRSYLARLVREQPFPTPYVAQNQTKDGRLIEVQVDWNYKRDSQGRVTGFISVISDVTERTRLESQLRQSHKMEAIGTLAGGIAHEFNNVLTAILGFADLAQYEIPKGSSARSYLRETLQAGYRAKDLVQQILAFSSQSDQARETLSFSLVLQEVLTLVRASVPTTIAIRQHLPEEDTWVLANRTQMHQVIMNLCANAEYAMREMGGLLEIRLDSVNIDRGVDKCQLAIAPGPHVRLTIRDTGDGMPPDVLPRIFDPFFTTKGVGEGTGMGLAIVHGIVTSHGGAITVESTPREGTTFVIYLPRLLHAIPRETTTSEEELPRGEGRILFVDDEDMLARLGHETLRRLGYDVVAYTSSLEALEAFQAAPHRFDVVITDQTMPEMTGETLVGELRRIRPDIPIILCTGFSHRVNAEKAETLGVNALMMKPVVMRELAVTIQQVLNKRRAQET